MSSGISMANTNYMECDRLLTTKEAAVIAGLAPGTLARARVYGTPGYPQYCKIGKAVRYKQSTLVAWLADQKEYTHTSAEAGAN